MCQIVGLDNHNFHPSCLLPLQNKRSLHNTFTINNISSYFHREMEKVPKLERTDAITVDPRRP